VIGCMVECLSRKLLPQFKTDGAILFQLLHKGSILCGRREYTDMGKVLGCSANHGRSANVNMLGSNGGRRVWLGYSLFEGIEVNHHKFNRVDIQPGYFVNIGLMAGTCQQSAMNRRMKSLNTAVQTFFKS